MKPKKLDIPDKWIAGYLLGEKVRGNPNATVADAVAHWQEQERMQREMRDRIRKRLRTVPPIGPYRKGAP